MVKKENPDGKSFSIFFLLLIFLLLCNYLLAQTGFTLTHSSTYDQNIFRNYHQISDWVHQTGLFYSRALVLNKLAFRINYTGNFNFFQEYQARHFHVHQPGFEAAYKIYPAAKLNAGLNFQSVLNKIEYELYNSRNWQAYAQLQLDAWPTSPLQIGYQFAWRDYPNLAEFSYYEQLGFLQFKHFFPTKTTFISEIYLTGKKYSHSQTTEEIIITGPGRNNGMEHGKGHKKGIPAPDTTIIAKNLTVPGACRWSLIFRAAQSLTPKLGLSVQYFRQFQPDQTGRYLGELDYFYYKDDELYDDPFTYGSHEWELQVTWLLPGATRLRGEIEYHDKAYTYQIPTEDADPSEYRQDILKNYGLLFTWPIRQFKSIKNINFNLAYFYIVNHSNEVYFDYHGGSLRVGLDFDLK